MLGRAPAERSWAEGPAAGPRGLGERSPAESTSADEERPSGAPRVQDKKASVPARCPPSTWAGVHGGGAAAAKGAARAREQPVPLRPIAAPARDEHAAARGGSRSRRCPCPQPPGASWEPAARGPRRPNEASMLIQTNAQGGMRAMAHWWRLSCSGERRAAPPHQNVAKKLGPLVPAAKPSSFSPRTTSQRPSWHRGQARARPRAAKRPSAKEGGRHQTGVARMLWTRATQQRQREGKRR